MNVLNYIQHIYEACLPSQRVQHAAPNAYTIDYEHPGKYLESGPQTTMSDEDFSFAQQQLQIQTFDLAALKTFHTWKQGYFNRTQGQGKTIGNQTIGNMLHAKALIGCHEHAYLLASVARKYGIPAVFVDVINIAWAKKYHEFIQYFRGHALLELFLDQQWMLVDPAAGTYIRQYDPRNPIIPPTNIGGPEGWYVLYKGIDSVNRKTLHWYIRRYARMIKRKHRLFQYPTYTVQQLCPTT